jgi:hypothetical protein
MARKKSIVIPELTALQAAYVDVRAKGVKQASAAKEVGISKENARDLEKKTDVAVALAAARSAYQETAKIERQDVVDGIKEAIEVARLQADAQGMIAGWRELAKLCGLYAPEVKRLELTLSAQRAKSKYEGLSDEQLFQIATGTIIDGVAERVPN